MKTLVRKCAKLVLPALLATYVAANSISPLQAYAAPPLISNDTLLRVCSDVYLQDYSWVEQLDPGDKYVSHSSFVGTAMLCDGAAPVVGVDLAARACNGEMITPVYEKRPWWKKWGKKVEFKGWACAEE